MPHGKLPFDIDVAVARIEAAVKPFPKAARFELAEEGFASPFKLLAACTISIRTYDEVTLICAGRLFARARTAEEMSCLSPDALDAVIRQSTCHERKLPAACRVPAARCRRASIIQPSTQR